MVRYKHALHLSSASMLLLLRIDGACTTQAALTNCVCFENFSSNTSLSRQRPSPEPELPVFLPKVTKVLPVATLLTIRYRPGTRRRLNVCCGLCCCC